jgi:hypothetical protein
MLKDITAPVVQATAPVVKVLCEHEWRNKRLSLKPIVWVQRCKLCGEERPL